MNPDDCVPVGKIVGAHGIKGYVKIHCEVDTFSSSDAGRCVFIADTSGAIRTVSIVDLKFQGRMWLLLFSNVSDRNQAESLIGSKILVERSSLPELEEDTYYWSDLVGLSVFSSDDHCMGTIESIFETGSNDVYVVRTPESGEILIPAIASVVLEIDLTQKIMRVNLPEGL